MIPWWVAVITMFGGWIIGVLLTAVAKGSWKDGGKE